jgi:hypothetical protein
MCLRFVFLLITRVAAWLRLSRREERWKTAEVLILRHQAAVLQRRQPCRPKLNWADRALLAALLGLIPKARRQGLRLLVTADTIVRWHRDIVRRRWAARSACGRTGCPTTRRSMQALVRRGSPREPRLGIPKDPRRAGRPGGQGRSIDRMGDPRGQRHRPGLAADRADLVTIPAVPGRGDPGAAFFTADPACCRYHIAEVKPSGFTRAGDASAPQPTRSARPCPSCQCGAGKSSCCWPNGTWHVAGRRPS